MIDIVLYRVRIGCFCMPRKHRCMVKGLYVCRTTVSVCLRLVLAMTILIVASGDVEQNPGPPKNNRQRQLSFAAQTSPLPSPIETRQRQQQKAPESDNSESVLSFLREMKLELRSDFESVNRKIDGINSQINDIKQENEELRKENQELRSEISSLKSNVDKIEAQSRRNNLRFKGIEGQATEDWGVTEGKVRQFIKHDLNLPDMENVEIERAHRVGSHGAISCPIVVKFQCFKDKDRILSQAKRTLTSESPHSVNEDFTQRVLQHRRELGKRLVEARREGKFASISYDKLILEDSVYKYDDVNDKIVCVGKSRRKPSRNMNNNQSRDRIVNDSQTATTSNQAHPVGGQGYTHSS